MRRFVPALALAVLAFALPPIAAAMKTSFFFI